MASVAGFVCERYNITPNEGMWFKESKKKIWKEYIRERYGTDPDMRSKNVDVIILDLSFNGGGSLSEAIQIIGFFNPFAE